MAAYSSDVAKVLNLNSSDQEAYEEILNDYFGDNSTLYDDSSSSGEDDEVQPEHQASTNISEDEEFVPVIPDPTELIIPLRHPPTTTIQLQPQSTHSSNEADRNLNIPCICKTTPCYSVFCPEQIEEFRMEYLELEKSELDMVLLGKISAGIHLDKMTRNSKQSQQSERKSSRTDYFHHGHKICRSFFRYLHSIGQDKLNALVQHYKAKGIEARTHKNKKRLPSKALTYVETRAVVDFIVNYAGTHAIQLPGRTPKHWNTNIQLLPTNCTKTKVYNEYNVAAENGSLRVVQLRTFHHLWKSLVPYIKTMPPASDLCWTCQQGISKLSSSRNIPSALDELKKHQDCVEKERNHYVKVCREIKESPLDKMHISFDFAQQMHYPQNPLQPGPIYFKTPRKCGLFGIKNEPLQTQVNYLIDEAHACGKGANTVVSLVHNYLECHSSSARHLFMHADNCAGQNKNSVMIWYLMWRCLTNRNDSITLSFLISGHTKFSPDGGFGLIKRKLKRTKVDCLEDIVNVVNESSTMNTAKLVGNETGPSNVHTFDWTSFLSSFFNKVKDIKSSHHFTVDNSSTVTIKQFVDSPEKRQQLMTTRPSLHEMPPVLPPSGLSNQRQWYLYRQIRPFVSDACQDIVTPKPNCPERTAVSEDEDDSPPPPLSKRAKSGSAQPSRGRGRGRGQVQT